MTNTNTDWEKEFIESGAALEHARWARWQNYLHSFLTWNEDLKAWVLPHEKKARWQSQIQTYYGALSEQEKESDRKEVREYLPLVRKEKEKSYQEGDKVGFERGVAAEREKNNRVLYALALMWNQYCGERGHLFMMAGEAALEELQRAGLLGDNHEEIDYKKIDALLTPTNTV